MDDGRGGHYSLFLLCFCEGPNAPFALPDLDLDLHIDVEYQNYYNDQFQRSW